STSERRRAPRSGRPAACQVHPLIAYLFVVRSAHVTAWPCAEKPMVPFRRPRLIKPIRLHFASVSDSGGSRPRQRSCRAPSRPPDDVLASTSTHCGHLPRCLAAGGGGIARRTRAMASRCFGTPKNAGVHAAIHVHVPCDRIRVGGGLSSPWIDRKGSIFSCARGRC